MTPLESQLRIIIERTRRESERLQRAADTELEQLVLNQLENPDRDLDHEEGVRRHLWKAANLQDASEFLERRLLDAADGWIVDEPLPTGRHIDELQDFMARFDIPSGCVYVAWDARPVSFRYVGRVGSEVNSPRPLSLNGHERLTEALQDAARFAALAPSRAHHMEALEGALLLVIEHEHGELPENNQVRGFIAPGDAADRLERVGTALKRIGERVRRPE